MSFNGSGVYSLPGAALATGGTVSATEHNQFRNDVATALNLCVLKDGQQTITANLPMNGKKITGLAVATTSGDALSYGAAAAVSTLTTTSTINGLTVSGGAQRTSVGYQAGVVGTYNQTFGYQAGKALTSGDQNSFFGWVSGSSTTSGASNSSFGNAALYTNTTGSNNTALGQGALQLNTTASNNTAVGFQAGYSNTTGTGNQFVGFKAGYNTTGSYNTFIGVNSNGLIGAGGNVTTGSKNTIIGGFDGNNGVLDIRTANNYIVLSDGDGNPRAYCDNSGNWFDAGQRTITGVVKSIGVYNNTTGSAANMVSISDGQFARSTSALKYKKDVRDLEEVEISKFRPVRYKSKCEGDDQTKDFLGFIADEYVESHPELVSFGADGEVESFNYERMTAVLCKYVQQLEARLSALEGAK